MSITMNLKTHIETVKAYSDETILGAIKQLSAKINRSGRAQEWEEYRLRALQIVAKERGLK